MMNFLGIDIGTSSVKAIIACKDGVLFKEKRKYSDTTLEGWRAAIYDAVKSLSDKVKGEISGISFSSQVGTYIIDGKDIIHWWEGIGKEELSTLNKKYSDEFFIDQISMRHPDIVSYPLPRFLYIKKHFPKAQKVCMPKDYFIEEFTGNFVSDFFSYRGLYNFNKKTIPTELLSVLEINFSIPSLISPSAIAGYLTKEAAEKLSLPEKTPVYTGMNDFFSGLIGMGVNSIGDAFEISGTSEHVGFIGDSLSDSRAVSGSFIEGFATYGGTKASGLSCDFALNNLSAPLKEIPKGKKLPVFLPYLSGERAPIYDENARGVFFGIDSKTTKEDMAYAVFEGVCFSLFDIADSIKMQKGERLITGGGSSKDMLMAEIKAELFNREIIICREGDTSALGASINAMVGAGVFENYKAAAKLVEFEATVKPNGKNREFLLERFELYRSLYKSLKNDFIKFNKIKEK